MKKIFSIIVVLTLVIVSSLSVAKVDSATNVLWDYFMFYKGTVDTEDYYSGIITADITIPSDGKRVSVDIPYDEQFVEEVYTMEELEADRTYQYAEIKFFDKSVSGMAIYTIPILDFRADFPADSDINLLAGEIVLDIAAIKLAYGITDNITDIEIQIPTLYSQYFESVLINLVNQYNSEGRVTFSYFNPETISDFVATWSDINTYSDYHTVQTTINFASPVNKVSIYVPNSRYHQADYGGDLPYIILKDAGGVVLFESDLRNIGNGNFTDLVLLDIQQLGTDHTFDSTLVSDMIIQIPQNYSTIPTGYISYLNDNTIVTFDASLYYVYYMTDGKVIYKAPFLTIPPTYEGYKIDHSFVNWTTASGAIYNYEQVTSDMLLNNVLYLYGNYIKATGVDYDPTDPVADDTGGLANLLATLNMDSLFGYVFVYVSVLIALIVTMLRYNIPTIMLGIAMLLLTSLFLYLGWLPLIIAIIGYTSTIFILYLTLGGD